MVACTRRSPARHRNAAATACSLRDTDTVEELDMTGASRDEAAPSGKTGAADAEPIPFEREMDPAYGGLVEVSPSIRRITARNPGPFTYLGTGVYVVGRGEVAVIDPGPDLPEHVSALIEALSGERVTAILTTHSHADHSPAARPLQAATGAPVYGRSDPSVGGEGEEADAAFRPDVELADGQDVSGPGWTLRAMATPGHVSNHLAFVLPQENALFSGDHVMGWSTTIVSPPHGDMDDYLASLDRVRDGGFDVLWPTHGPPVRNPDRFLRAYKGHRLARERQVLTALAKGPAAIAEMTAALYANVDPRLHGAAARSLWAHLIRLVRAGTVQADGGEATLDATYRLA